jgi:hypothetical protein
MNTTLLATVALTVSTLAAPVMAQECLQDQYGNQYTITRDAVNKAISGTALVVQRGNEIWTLSGSYATNKSGSKVREQQLTMTDSTSTNQLYMLRGTYPNFAWYYNGTYGSQEASWVACGANVAPAASGSEGRQGVR